MPTQGNRFTAGRVTPLQRVFLWLLGCLLVFIFVFANLGSDLTLSQFSAPAEAPSSNTAVDQSRYATARQLAALAATPQEQQYAVLAMRAADHELDRSFASAVRDSGSGRRALTPEAASALRRAGELKQVIRADEAGVAAAAAEQSTHPENTPGRVHEQIRRGTKVLQLLDT